jgi:hypothetical protein
MPDSRPPQGDLPPAELDLLRRAAELVAETPRLVAQARALVRWSQELRLVVENLRNSYGRPGAVTPARRPARSR